MLKLSCKMWNTAFICS